MGSLCSPENINAAPNTVPRNRSKKPQNGYNDSLGSHTNKDVSISKSNTSTGIDPDLVDDLDTFDQSDHEQPINALFTPPNSQNMHSNTSRGGLKEIQKDIGVIDDDEEAGKKQQKGFQIVVSPPAQPEPAYSYPDTPDINDNTDDGIKKPEKIDPTLNGQILWKKVADFSALLPRDVKLKLWNGVFKTETDYQQHEIKRISKVLRTFVMLQLTREYKKTNETVPNEIKVQLPGAVKEPSKFIASFLKKDESFIDNTFLTIYQTLIERFQTTDDTKKVKYAKKVKTSQDNYAELTKEALKTEFNEDDFLKTAFLQYMLYAFQIKLDIDNAKNK